MILPAIGPSVIRFEASMKKIILLKKFFATIHSFFTFKYYSDIVEENFLFSFSFDPLFMNRREIRACFVGEKLWI